MCYYTKILFVHVDATKIFGQVHQRLGSIYRGKGKMRWFAFWRQRSWRFSRPDHKRVDGIGSVELVDDSGFKLVDDSGFKFVDGIGSGLEVVVTVASSFWLTWVENKMTRGVW